MLFASLLLSMLALFWFCRGAWLHYYLPWRSARRLNLTVFRVKRQGAYLKLWLCDEHKRLLPQAKAGQHVLVFGQDLSGRAVSRAYSLTSDCSQRRYYQLIIKAEEGGRLSQALFQNTKLDDVLVCSYPRGRFLLKRSRAALVLVATGVGITPLLAMTYHALRQGRSVTLVYQARSKADVLFYSALKRLPKLRLEVCLSQPSSTWQGRTGRIDAGFLYTLGGSDAEYYFCAKAIVMEKLICDLSILGAHRCYKEAFSATASLQSHSLSLDDEQAESRDQRTVLDAFIAASIPLSYDCKGGSCGLCKLKVVSGDYKQVLESSVFCAQDEVLACCIQPTSSLVLERLPEEAQSRGAKAKAKTKGAPFVLASRAD